MAQDILMARQPIYDTALNVVAYELLYRDKANANASIFDDGNLATSQVLVNNYTSIYNSGELKTLPAFINLTKDLVQSDQIPGLNRHHIVIELLEDMAVDGDLVSGVQRLIKAGYRVALDDFIYSPEYDPIIKLAHIVKLDLMNMTRQQLIDHVEILKPFKVTLLAEKIETQEEFELCKDLGFKLFQGYFLCHPQIVEGKRLNTSELVVIELMSLLADPDITPAKIEQVLKKDPQLTYKILRIVNSSAYALVRKIESIEEAVVLIGIGEIKRWCALFSLTGASGKPDELTRHTLIKARMCELIAPTLHNLPPSSGFMMGIISGMDALLDIPIEDIMEQVALTEDIERAILFAEGDYGDLLCSVDSFIQAKWHKLPDSVSEQQLHQAYLDSLKWVTDTMKTVE
ncbi:EAL and HDOD domain-containing protein [Amphritea sp. HPY]|uniref:EAL and HDOD domain-containing protein n=1 Tax=Amphritea sp. HPY TaxID=3421652 RepID=UPI003D7D2973